MAKNIGKLGKVLGRHDYVVRHFGYTENGLAVLDFTSGYRSATPIIDIHIGKHPSKRK